MYGSSIHNFCSFMNKISLQVIFNSIRSRKDGSLGISLETPELTVEQKVEVMKLQNEILQAVFIPIDNPDVPEYKINTDLEQKTPAQRLRGALYVMWEQTNPQTSFEEFYKEKMEKIIEAVKRNLE